MPLLTYSGEVMEKMALYLSLFSFICIYMWKKRDFEKREIFCNFVI